MKDYYNLFVELSLQQCTNNDYDDKLKVNAHNVALKKLKRLQAEMKRNDSREILCLLLIHEDDRVKINAASLCLKMNVFVDQAVIVLKKIIDVSDDPTLCFSAKMLLQNVES